MQNSPNDRNPFKQLPEALEQVEVSDRLSPQPPGTRTHIALNTDFNPESLSAHSEDLTIMQVASPVLGAEAGNDLTVGQILPNPSRQNLASVVLVDRASPSPPKPGVVEQIRSSSQPTQIERVDLSPNPIAQFSLQDDTKNLNAGVAVGQNLGNTIIQYPPTVQNLTDRTVAQYSDSAIHNPAEQTVHQAILPSSIELDRTVYQLGRSQSLPSSTLAIVPKNRAHIQLFHPSIVRDLFRTSGSFTSRFISNTGEFFYSIWKKIDLKQLQSRFYPGKQQAVMKIASSSSCIVMDSQERPSLEQYQKKLRELDLCRLSFAKELARNGKFRNAIAMAEQISETSHFFKDSQKLIQSWKQF